MRNWGVYQEGKNASIRCNSNPKLANNPYLKDSQDWRDWNAGWNSDVDYPKFQEKVVVK
jgi:hypothetical protein